MKKNRYEYNGKGITFEDDYSRTFEQFEKEFGENHIFGGMVPKLRKVELKKAFEIATTKQEEPKKETPAK